MREAGIDRALLWPSLGLSIEERFGNDATARHVVSHSFNQWLHEHWGFCYDDAIFAPPLISLAIVDEALRELEWALERGAHDIYIQPATAPAPGGRRRSIAPPEFDPFWKVVEEADVLVGVHAGDAGIQRYLNEFEGTPEQDTEYLKDFDRGTRAFSIFIGMYELPVGGHHRDPSPRHRGDGPAKGTDVTTTSDTTTTALGECRAWIDQHWDPDLTVRKWWSLLAEAHWAAPHWPKEWFGHRLSPSDATAASRILRESGALGPPSGFGMAMAGPTVLACGDDDQKRRHLRPIVTGEVSYCQLFSEPGAGSDLAGLQTRAGRDGNGWVVTGQKVWTSAGDIADWGMLLARTDFDAPKHAGISYFLIDMHQPGVEVRPLREMTGRSFFNEVFLSEAHVRAEDLIGGEGNGWKVANTTLAFERTLSGEHASTLTSRAQPGTVAGYLDLRAGDVVGEAEDGTRASNPWVGADALVHLARLTGQSARPAVREDLVRLSSLERLVAITASRAKAMQAGGGDLPGLPNLAKMGQNHAYRLARDLTFSILGPAAMVYDYDTSVSGDPDLGAYVEAALFAQAPPIYGGSDQIQRNIVGERVLGLPREPGPDRSVPFRDLPRNG